MLEIEELAIEGYERVVEGRDPSSGLHCFIAVHKTDLGPALGGLRIYPYPDPKEAKEDALRLAKAMTYKSAMAEIGLGGGKAVLIADPKKQKSEALLFSFAEVVNHLEGAYITAEDVGSSIEDMLVLRKKSRYVAALPTESSSGDPAPFTVWGVFQGMRAVARFLWGNSSLSGKRVAIQGLGNVGQKLARLLFWEGAELIVSDLDEERALQTARLYEAAIGSPTNFHKTPCDIFSPCAMGGILKPEAIAELACLAVAGSANNQLKNRECGDLLQARKILYAPDYVINAGGVINAAAEFEPGGYSPKWALNKINRLYDLLLDIFKLAAKEHKAANRVADEIAERKLAEGVGKRSRPLVFH